MSVNGTTIVEPVSITDVRTVLGESAYDLASLCRSSRINKWARYKPVISSRTDITTRAQYEQMASQFTVNWGFERTGFISGTSIAALAAAAEAGGADWKYNRPVSGVCRLGDFAGYNHAALPPCSLSLPSGTQLKGTQYTLSLTTAPRNGGLGLSDFKDALGGDNNWASMKWAVATIKGRNSTSESVTLERLMSADQSFDTTRTLSTLGEYELLVMITNAPSADAAGGAYYYLLIPGGYTKVNVISAWLTVSFSGFSRGYNSSNSVITSLSIRYSIQNNTDVTATVGLFILCKPKSSSLVGDPQVNRTLSVVAHGVETGTLSVAVSVPVNEQNGYEACVGYLYAGTYHYFNTSGEEVDSVSDAWTELGSVVVGPPVVGGDVTQVG